MTKQEFADWFTQRDAFEAMPRAEQFYMDLAKYKDDEMRSEIIMLNWLNLAYEAGQQSVLRVEETGHE